MGQSMQVADQGLGHRAIGCNRAEPVLQASAAAHAGEATTTPDIADDLSFRKLKLRLVKP
jgi:hypothetical protein